MTWREDEEFMRGGGEEVRKAGIQSRQFSGKYVGEVFHTLVSVNASDRECVTYSGDRFRRICNTDDDGFDSLRQQVEANIQQSGYPRRKGGMNTKKGFQFVIFDQMGFR